MVRVMVSAVAMGAIVVVVATLLFFHLQPSSNSANSAIAASTSVMTQPSEVYGTNTNEAIASTAVAAGTSTSASATEPQFSNGYGDWFAVSSLPAYCQGLDPLGVFSSRSDGIYLNNTRLDVDSSTFKVFCQVSGELEFSKDANQIYVE